MLDKDNYHNPTIFRYNANAFLSALHAVDAMLGKEMERAKQTDWLRPRREALRKDPLVGRFSRGRNIVLHQQAIVRGSRIEAGLFRGSSIKIAQQIDVNHDQPSRAILTGAIQPSWVGWLIDEEHAAVGEQLGLRRMYYVKELSDSEDAATVSWRALARVSRLVAEAHTLLGSKLPPYEETGDEADAHSVGEINLLLESDIDLTAFDRWGWSEAFSFLKAHNQEEDFDDDGSQ
jgi:hypothetical protein